MDFLPALFFNFISIARNSQFSQVLVRLRNLIICLFYIIALSVVLCDHANATYIAAYVGADYVVVGADSRESYENGDSPKDNVCKIGFIGKHYIVSLEGKPTYGVDGSDIIDIARNLDATSKYNDTDAFALALSSNLVNNLNGHNLHIDPAPYKHGITSVVTIAGLDNSGPVWAIVPIVTDGSRFKALGIELHNRPNKFVNLGLADATLHAHERIQSDMFASTQLSQMVEPDREEYFMELIVKDIIKFGEVSNVGGVPTVALLSKSGVSWWTKTASCPPT